MISNVDGESSHVSVVVISNLDEDDASFASVAAVTNGPILVTSGDD